MLKDDSSYPLDETANILVEAVQVLLNEKNYDGEGHERFAIARNYATLIPNAVKFVREALSTTPTSALAPIVEALELADFYTHQGVHRGPDDENWLKAKSKIKQALSLCGVKEEQK